MRNIFLFIRRYFTFLAFLVLQFIALWMLFSYNRHHKAVGMGLGQQVTGLMNKQVDRLDDYFNQGEENRRVHRMNDSLLNLLQSNFNAPDSSRNMVVDTLLIDSTKSVRRYYWMGAKVVYNTVNFEKNYLQLDRGSALGVKEQMAVLNSDGAVVGQVVTVSRNFSQVMSLLHVQSIVSASLKKTGESGRVKWDGKHPNIILMEGIPRNVQLKVGDTVVTSRYSYNFPADKIIGTIVKITSDPATGFYILRLRPAVNFANVQQVFIVENLFRDEQVELDAETDKKIDQQTKTNR
jgi:rod shape-determining protein MreC